MFEWLRYLKKLALLSAHGKTGQLSQMLRTNRNCSQCPFQTYPAVSKKFHQGRRDEIAHKEEKLFRVRKQAKQTIIYLFFSL